MLKELNELQLLIEKKTRYVVATETIGYDVSITVDGEEKLISSIISQLNANIERMKRDMLSNFLQV